MYITRGLEPGESVERRIELEEWLAYAESSAELTRDGPFQSDDRPGFFNLRVGEVETWLSWSDGEIYTENPPTAVRARMHHIADLFDATVQGEEGESYDEEGNPIPLEANRQPPVARWDAFLLGGPLLCAIINPVFALASLLATSGMIIAAFVLFDGIVAIAAATASVLMLFGLILIRVSTLVT